MVNSVAETSVFLAALWVCGVQSRVCGLSALFTFNRRLIRGRSAGLGGETDAARVRNIVQIAVCYTRDELLSEPGVGIVTALGIEHWLESCGLHLRKN